jgi:hypothetical protein
VFRVRDLFWALLIAGLIVSWRLQIASHHEIRTEHPNIRSYREDTVHRLWRIKGQIVRMERQLEALNTQKYNSNDEDVR